MIASELGKPDPAARDETEAPEPKKRYFEAAGGAL